MGSNPIWCSDFSDFPVGSIVTPLKREILENLRQDFDNRMLGKTVGFERKNSLWSQNFHKTSLMSFHVDIPVRCLIFSN